MDFIKYIILGILQGITEPIPVSSSGHLVILRKILSDQFVYDLNFEIIVNFGSLLAVLVYFKKDIIKIIQDFFNYLKRKEEKTKTNYNYAWLIVIGTIPAGIFGLLFKDLIENSLTNIKIIGVSLLITAFLLYLIKDLKGTKNKKEITLKDALIIGLFQVVALIPGISRSGATIVGGIFQGLKRETAFKYSFFLYIPISLATMILGVKDLIHSSNLIFPYLIGMLMAGIFTYIVLNWLEKIIKKGQLIYFVYYCLFLGTLVLLFL
ncbi:MAG: undecaprenyl-diphosphate phosphatase [Bacilli bacterium]|jgi:undecaprenyl-diphosphatase